MTINPQEVLTVALSPKESKPCLKCVGGNKMTIEQILDRHHYAAI